MTLRSLWFALHVPRGNSRAAANIPKFVGASKIPSVQQYPAIDQQMQTRYYFRQRLETQSSIHCQSLVLELLIDVVK
jgi:hypothetical protein